MTTPHTSFIVTLTKTARGYSFDSMSASGTNSRKTHAPSQPRPNRIQNRLIKEIEMLQEDDPAARAPLSDALRSSPLPSSSLPPDILCDVNRPAFVPKAHPSFTPHAMTASQRAHFPTVKPELYLKYRNFMVDAYNVNPNRYLTFIACRKVLRGDVNVLQRIYKFLSKQQLLNYNLDYKGNYAFLNATPLMSTPSTTQCPNSRSWSLDTDALTFVSINKFFSRGLRLYCDGCKLISGAAWYTREDHNLCFECHAKLSGDEVQGYVTMDIVKKLEVASKETKAPKNAWSIEENIKLLDFMGASEGKTWDDLLELFEHKKTVQDAVVQFMQFPIITSPSHLPTELQLRLPLSDQIHLLNQHYRRSHYGRGQSNGYALPKAQSSTRFKALAAAVLQRYASKMHSLNDIEKTIQTTNTKISQDKLVYKCADS